MFTRCCFKMPSLFLCHVSKQNILLESKRRVASGDLGMPHLDDEVCRRRSDKLPSGVKR